MAIWSHSQEVVLAQAGSGSAPTIPWDWKPSPELQSFFRKLAFILGLVWIVYILAQYAVPSKRSRMMGGQIKMGNIVAAGVLIVMMLDLALVPTAVNFVINVFWQLAGLFGLTG